MPDYRLYPLGTDHKILYRGLNANCEDDKAAIHFARTFFRTETQVEIWAGDRLVGRAVTPRRNELWMWCIESDAGE